MIRVVARVAAFVVLGAWGAVPATAARLPAAVAEPVLDLPALLARYPADSLVVPLKRFERDHGRGPEGGEAALLLGRLHFARGEYVQAAAAFSRAAARLDPTRKPEARYWAGLSWLALREPNQARAALEEVEASDSPRRPEAMLGVALAWEQASRPDRALDELERLLEGDPGEAGPAALERLMAITERLRMPDKAERARTRLLRDYPRSIEAARAAAPAAGLTSTQGAGQVAVQIGAFSSSTRARALAESARHSGFKGATLVSRGEGPSRLYLVRLGSYATTEEARKIGEQAARTLGVIYKLVGAD